MFDVHTLKAQVNLIDLVGRDTTLKRKTANEYSAPCPFCGGRDRFNVQADKWLCRNCTQGKWQDAIAYVMRRENCDFASACRFLGAVETLPIRTRAVPIQLQPSAPKDDWQARARQVIEQCAATLWSDAGARARVWLAARGLNDDTLKRWNIGYLPGAPSEYRAVAGLRVPCGIIIPCEIDDTLWYIKTRRASGEPKYEQVAGGHSALFGADTLAGKRVAMVVEGEFDAMLLYQVAGDLVGVVTMGGATTYPSDEMLGYLATVLEWLICFDLDDAGNKGASWWLENSERARRVFLPKIAEGVKDISDYYRAGGDLRAWVQFQLGDDALPTNDEPLAALYAERDRLRTRWEQALNREDFDERDWSAIDADLRRVLDRIRIEEMNARALAIWERIKTKGGL